MPETIKQQHQFLQRTLENNLIKIFNHFHSQKRENDRYNNLSTARLHSGIILARSLDKHNQNQQLRQELDTLHLETQGISTTSEHSSSQILNIFQLRYLVAYSQIKPDYHREIKTTVRSYLENFPTASFNNDTTQVESHDRRTPSPLLYEYLLLLSDICLTLGDEQAIERLHLFFHNFMRQKNYHDICKYHRILGFLAVPPATYKDIAKDIILQHLFRINYMRSALKKDPYRFLEQLYLNLSQIPEATIYNFGSALLVRQAETFNQRIRFIPMESILQEMLQLTGILQLHMSIKENCLNSLQPFSDKDLFSWEDSHAAAEITSGQLLPQESTTQNYSKTTFISDQIEQPTLFVAADRNWSKKYQSRVNDNSKPFNLGAKTVITSTTPTLIQDNQQFILVKNTFSALLKLAIANRRNYSGKVIALTGSVGKTSTATMLHDILANFGSTYKNISFFNHQTGVPKSVANIPRSSDYSVIEMGMGRPMSILPKTLLTRPHIAIVVEIQHDHMEFHDSIDSVIQTKMEIIEGLAPGGAVILNRDSLHFPTMLGIAHAKGVSRILTFGEHPLADIRATSISLLPDCSHIEIDICGKKTAYNLSLPGAHMAMNSLAVCAALNQLGVDLKEAAPWFASLKPASGRNEIFTAKLDSGKYIKIINDSFNANPSSMRSSFHILSLTEPEKSGKRIMVIGDMGELGPNTRKYHEDLAADVNNSGIDVVLSIGEFTRYLDSKIRHDIEHHHFSTAEDLKSRLLNSMDDGDVIAVKGSARGQELEKLIHYFKSLPSGTERTTSAEK